MVVVDGDNQIFGRMASSIAKSLMKGEEVHLINAEKIVIKGEPSMISARYIQKRQIRHKGSPERSPVWSKVPHYLVKRMIRGMLPRESSRGREAFKKLRVYSGNPKNLQGALIFETSKFDGSSRFITIKGICKLIGNQQG